MRQVRGRRPIDAATVYARRGWPVFPCHAPLNRDGAMVCTCGVPDCSSPGKHPRVAGGLNSATTDVTQVHEWWARWPRANVGIRAGDVSGLVVIDVDPDHGGDATLKDLLQRHGLFPPCRIVQTGSGGAHYYFRHPGGVIQNDTGRRLGHGVDVRGDGGYVIAPPSRHVSGDVYRVAARGGDIPDLPDWLLAMISPPEPERVARPARRPDEQVVNATSWGQAALFGELERLEGAEKGTRNDTLNRVAFRLGQIMGTGNLTEAEIEQILVERACSIGLGEREALGTVRSGLQAGQAIPRGPAQGSSMAPTSASRDVDAEPGGV